MTLIEVVSGFALLFLMVWVTMYVTAKVTAVLFCKFLQEELEKYAKELTEKLERMRRKDGTV